MVALLYNYVNCSTNFVTYGKRDNISTNRPNNSASSLQTVAAPVMPYISGLLEAKGVSKTAAKIVKQSW